MTAPSTLGVAIIGLGVGEQHARAYLRSGRCALRAVYDLDPARGERLIGELGQGAVARRFEEILADPSVDLISIASYDDDHFEQVVAALRAGKHVFVEKPLCRTAEELSTVQAAWRASGKALGSNLVLRSAPLYRWLRQAIREGALGRVYAFDGDYLYGRLWKITEGWRKDVEGYSVMQGGGVHLVDLMLWLTGERPVSVVTAGNRICTEATAFRYCDFMASTFQFASGLVGRITANFGCVHRHQHVVRVFGTKATVLYDDAGPRLHTQRDPGAPPAAVDLAPLPETKGELIPAFVDAILDGADLQAQTRHDVAVISACLAADAALAQQRAVEVRDP